MPDTSALDAALERIRSGSHTATDVAVLRRAYLTGQITIASGQRAVAIGGSADGAVIVTGDGPVTVQGASADDLRRLLADIQNEFKAHAQTALDPRERRDRSRMLQRVRRTWIEGYLEDSLHGASLQALGLKERADAVPNRWGMVVQQPDHATRTLPPNTSIVQVFDDLDNELLILGEPGSGKTTLLLELTRARLDRARRDEVLPMPIVFPLTTWAAKRLPLTDWLVDELNQRYDVPRQIGNTWVANDRILPLLDGLDEVAAEHRAACVGAINAYREGRARVLPGLVVTSRVADYDALTARLRLQGAVLLQQFSNEQIDAYLSSTGEQLAGVRAALRADATLQELAMSPLLLSTMTLAYQGAPADALPTNGTVEERRRQLFATYVDQMFRRRLGNVLYTREQTLHWLKWLAMALNKQAQTIFYLERLQPEWLAAPMHRLWYTVADRIGSGLVIWLVASVAFALVYASKEGADLRSGAELGAVGALVAALFGGKWNAPSDERRPWWFTMRSMATGWLVVAVLSGLVFRLIGGQNAWLTGGAVCGLAGAVAGRLSGSPAIRPRYITVTEAIRWSGSRVLPSIMGWLVFGLAFGPVIELAGTEHDWPPDISADVILSVILGVASGLMFAIIGGIVGGLSGRELGTNSTPNQGIHRSARSALLVSIIIGLPLGLVFGLLYGLVVALTSNPHYGDIFDKEVAFSVTLLVGLVVGLSFGGYACLSHFALRLVLWRAKSLPLDPIHFLDHATERIFLRRVGGGYIFVHRLLQEYFASQGTTANELPSTGIMGAVTTFSSVSNVRDVTSPTPDNEGY